MRAWSASRSMGASARPYFRSDSTGLSCEVSDASTVSDVQSQVEKCFGVPAEEQKLLFNGSVLSTEESLSSFGVKDNSEISLVVALEGGAKGKKKKKDTKKGKKKKRKNLSLRR